MPGTWLRKELTTTMSIGNYTDHQLFALWAADCAEHVLPLFVDAVPDDQRPTAAIAAARDWVDGKIKMPDARKAAFAAHAAARETDNHASRFAARAAGHAAATAHVADHAKHAAAYALKAVSDIDAERQWQREQLPSQLQCLP
jgi:hypothetical protein